MKNKLTTKQLCVGGLMLAISIASMFFKNINPLISGPIVNLCLMITTLSCGIYLGILLSVITPVASFLITGSHIIAAVPTIMIFIGLGNIILVLFTGLGSKLAGKLLHDKKMDRRLKSVITLAPSLAVGSLVKFFFMTATIVRWILPTFGTSLNEKLISKASYMFSGLQLITALIAAAACCIIWPLILPALEKQQ